MPTARVINGKAIAKALRAALKGDVAALTAKHGRVRCALVCSTLHPSNPSLSLNALFVRVRLQAPALGLIMVGGRKDSALYVRNKNAACRRTGIRSENFLFDEGVSQVSTCIERHRH